MKVKRVPPLFNHQKKSVKFYRENDRVFDSSDPGTGKTRVALEAIQASGDTTLVIAPKSLLRSAWEEDAKLFTPDLKTSIAFAANRHKAFEAKADIYVTNTDAAKWLSEQPASFFRRFGRLVIDESSYYKHHTSQRSKAMNRIKRYFARRNLLSGTPAPNTITDLWHQAFLLDDGKRLGTSFYAFRAAVCVPEQVGPMPNMLRWIDRDGAELAVSQLMRDVSIRHILEECLDMPQLIERKLMYYMPEKQLKAYRTMEDHAVLMLERGEIVTAVNAASVTTKLLQIASGAVYNDAEEYSVVDNGRYELIMDLVEERKHPCLVFFLWTHQRDELVREAKRRGISYAVLDGSVTSANRRNEIVQAFQNGQIHALFAHPQTTAHGLTLTRARTTIWSSPTYNLEHTLQGNRRVYRAGQKHRTEIITVLAADTLETRVYDVMSGKGKRQLSLLNLLKGALERV